MKEFFHNEGIHSTTIQLEFVEVTGRGKDVERRSTTNNCGFKDLHAVSSDEDDCMLRCPAASEIEGTRCRESKCCFPTKDRNE